MSWVDVVEYEQLPIDRGVAALVGDHAVAIFRLADGAVYAIEHTDPYTGAPVLARGLVGSSGSRPTVASPLHKQRFDLRTGACLDGDLAVTTFPVDITNGVVRVAPPAQPTHPPTDPEVPAMTPAQIELVRTSFADVEPIADTAAGLFYDRLFEIAPETKALFNTDMAKQGRLLMTTLGVVVRRLDDLDDLLPTVTQLAERHVGYGVAAEHYAHVGAALLWTLERGLGDGYTPDVAEAWTTAYGVLSGAMISAAYGPTDSQLAS